MTESLRLRDAGIDHFAPCPRSAFEFARPQLQKSGESPYDMHFSRCFRLDEPDGDPDKSFISAGSYQLWLRRHEADGNLMVRRAFAREPTGAGW